MRIRSKALLAVPAAIASLAVGLAPMTARPAEAATVQPVAGPVLNGKITRSQVMDRAWNWVNRNVQYNQGATATAPGGNLRYRTDCSGFVSMAWLISPTGMSAPNTVSLPSYANKIAKANLKRGDILDWPGHHTVIFQKWANSAHTSIWLLEEANPSQDMNHRQASLSSFSSYTAYRYKKIVNG